jgi:hypothetical protein
MDVWMQDWINPMARLGVLYLKTIARHILSSWTLFIRGFCRVRGSDWNVECGYMTCVQSSAYIFDDKV